MPTSCLLADTLSAEHRALCREYAAVQQRCSRLIAQQRAEIERLQAQVLCLRAAAIEQVSTRAFIHTGPALPRPRDVLAGRVHAPPSLPDGPHAASVPGTLALLEASMAEADLVICQTGCLSHGAYWRENGHCRRSDKACLLPDAPASTHGAQRAYP